MALENSTVLVVNRTRGTLVGVEVTRADSFIARMWGLYGRRIILGDGVWLVPCNSIHTIGMKYEIDVIFLDRAGRVLRILECLRPGRLTWWVRRAYSTLELPAGAVQSSETRAGDELEFIATSSIFPSAETLGAGASLQRQAAGPGSVRGEDGGP